MAEKKSKFWILPVSIIVILAIIAAVIMTLVYFKYQKEDNDSKEKDNGLAEWGNTYYMYLDELAVKENKEKQKELGLEDSHSLISAKFIKLKDLVDPIMLLVYGNSEYHYNKVCYIDDGEVKVLSQSGEEKIELDYNVAEKEYDYYLVSEDTNSKKYTKLSEKIDNSSSAKTYEFKAEDKTDALDITGKVLETVTKEEEAFVPSVLDEDEFVIKEIKLDANNLEEKLLNEVKEAVEDLPNMEELITEEIKDKTNKKVAEVEEKKKSIEKTNSETKVAKEAEEKRKAEEAAKTIKAGNHNLKVGKYVGADFSEGTDHPVASGTYTYDIKSDGTYTWQTSSGRSGSGTYKIISMDSLGMGNNSYYAGLYGIQFSGGGTYCIRANNSFEELAGAGQTFKLVE